MEVPMRRLFALLPLLAAAAFAQPAPPDTGWVADETVVVTAQAPGPAFWHLKKGDAEVWILGSVSPMPKALVWNSRHLSELIDGAHAVLLPPQASAGFFEISWFLLTHHGLLSMPDDKKLEETLPPDLKARFAAARQLAGREASRYEDDPPIIAAMKLQGDFQKAKGLSTEDPARTVKEIARAKHVPVKKVADYGALGLIKEFLRLPMSAQQACLDNAISDVESNNLNAAAEAEAWAVGDLKGIKAHYSPMSMKRCIASTESFKKLYERGVADYLRVIEEALSKPGKTILLTDLGSLLRTSGVVEKLRAEGVLIEGPGE
jgi:uncharacterized protein YbaP (TraB family)